MNPEQIVLSAAIVLAVTAILTALAQVANRLMPEDWVRERHDLAVAIVFLVPIIFAITCLPGRAGPIGAQSEPAAITGPQVAASAPAPVPNPAPRVEDRRGTLAPTAPLAQTPFGPSMAATAEASGGGAVLPFSMPSWLPPVALAVWAVGALLLLARLAVDLKAVGHLVRSATPVGIPERFPLSSPIAMGTSPDVVSPMLAGYFRPVVLLPEGFQFDTAAAPVLEHEIAHADRHDNWIALGQRIVMAVFWWNLPLQILNPMIHGNREKLCDSRAVHITGAAQALAHALLDVATRQVRQPALPLAVAGERSALAARIKRLARPERLTPARPVATLAIMFPTLAAVALLSTPRIGEAQPHETGDAAKPTPQREQAYDAARRGDGAALEALIAEGVDPSKALKGDGTPLMGAVRGGHTDLVKTLLDRGVDTNVVSRGDGTALILAVRKQNQTIIQMLLDAGADPNLASPGDGMPLMIATKHKNHGMVRLLLQAGADPNLAMPGDGTPLMSAVRRKDVDMMYTLLKAGADPNLASAGDGTPLILAAARGHRASVEKLLHYGADPNMASEGDGNPLIAAAKHGHKSMAEMLLQAGADPNGYVFRDETPLINAARNGHLSLAKLLVERGADVSLTVKTVRTDPGGPYRSPLSEAERLGKTEMVTWLKAQGAAHRPPE